MYIVPNLRSDCKEPSGGSFKLLTVGAFSRYDLQTCAHSFVRNCKTVFNYVMDSKLTYYWLLMNFLANFKFDLREQLYGKMKMLIVGAFMIVG